MICGTKTTMPPKPAKTPLIKRSVNQPGFIIPPKKPPNNPTPFSIAFIGYSAAQKTLWNNKNKTTPIIK